MGARRRKVFLVLNRVSGHGLATWLPNSSSTTVQFLIFSTASDLKPMNDGVLSFLKRRYRTLQCNCILDKGEFVVLDFYYVEQLTEMNHLLSVWEKVQCTVIQNVWVFCALLSMSEDAKVCKTAVFAVEGEENKCNEIISHFSNDLAWISITSVLNGDDDNVPESITENQFAPSIVNHLNISTHAVSGREEEGSESRTVPIGIQIESIWSAVRTMEM